MIRLTASLVCLNPFGSENPFHILLDLYRKPIDSRCLPSVVWNARCIERDMGAQRKTALNLLTM